ncbi:MAG: hypothetical protein RhofKO_05790 [Rhodothermales bacterium]
MLDFFRELFASSFMPHGHCYQWLPEILWLHVFSDAWVALAYFSIPIALIYFTRRRTDLQFKRIFVLFGLFILLCGLTHVLSIWTVWHGTYRLSGLVKGATALVSVATAISLWPIIPQALRLPSPMMLNEANQQLEQEVKRREAVEQELRSHQEHLETMLEARTAELREREEQYRRIVEITQEGIWTIDLDGRTTFVNPTMASMLGYTVDDMQGASVFDFMDEDDRALASANLERRAKGQAEQHEFRFRRKDGSHVWTLVNTTPMFDDARNVVGALAMVNDITDRKAQTDALARYAEDLRRSNQELDDFAYVASHDLKEPLRGISYLADWIEEDAGEVLPEASREDLSRMKQRIRRLNALLDALLDYSRVGRKKGEIVELDAQSLVKDVFDVAAAHSGFQLHIETPLPILQAYHAPLQQVWMNLISNAVKHHDDPPGNIYIRAEPDGAHWAFTIADDGPGVLEVHRTKIFGMFQTLKPRDVVEGSGMGLALVKKIVTAEGGTIAYIDHATYRGAAFRFTWPIQPIPLPHGV